MQRKKQQHRALRTLNSRNRRQQKKLGKRRERLGRAVAQLLPFAGNVEPPNGKALIDNSICHDLQVKPIPKMGGVGVFTAAFFKPGQVLVRYAGETLSLEEGDGREAARQKGLRDPCVCACAACSLLSFLTGFHIAGTGGHVFFSTTFAVDPGMGDHVSHKINHSRRHPNARAKEDRTSKGIKCIVLRALRVRGLRIPFNCCFV